MNTPVIVQAKRSPIGKVDGKLKHVPPEQLAAQVMKNIVNECRLAAETIDDVILGNVIGPGGNIARLSALTAGFPVHIPGVTVDRQCGSGLEAINLAARLIQAGAGDIYLAGGVESCSLAPWKMMKPASLHEAPHIYTRARFSPNHIGDPDMGVAAENVAEKYNVSRKAQDTFAFSSHQKAIQAIDERLVSDEIVPIQYMTTKGDVVTVTEDECPRRNTSMEKLSQLRPAFKDGGTVTAGNACPINDGAAIVLIMSEHKALELGLTPMMRFVDSTVAGVDPNYLGIGPVPAVKKLLERQQINIEDIDLVEFNEAFASQVLASLNELQLPADKVNVGGGALAFGHPYGASGAILVTRLFHEMQRRDIKRSLATLGIGGGMGLATLFERT